MTSASAGIGTSLPTARITPRATTIIASSSTGPDTGTIFAARMAKYCGSTPCAAAAGAANDCVNNSATTSANRQRREACNFMESTSSKDTAGRIRMVFFFQAEDGIRDYKVTGVQTCALPI